MNIIIKALIRNIHVTRYTSNLISVRIRVPWRYHYPLNGRTIQSFACMHVRFLLWDILIVLARVFHSNRYFRVPPVDICISNKGDSSISLDITVQIVIVIKLTSSGLTCRHTLSKIIRCSYICLDAAVCRYTFKCCNVSLCWTYSIWLFIYYIKNIHILNYKKVLSLAQIDYPQPRTLCE